MLKMYLHRIQQFLRLNRTGRRVFVDAAILIGTMKMGLWLLSFRKLQCLLARLAVLPSIVRHKPAAPSPAEITRAVLTASRYVPGFHTCLTQALAVQFLLKREGYPAHLCIGVAKASPGQLQAHAWVESDGVVVIGGSDSKCYTPLLTANGEAM